jgi:hypothetical protein
VFVGASELPVDENLDKVASDGAKWLLVEAASTSGTSALKAWLGKGLHVIFRVTGPRKIAAVLEGVPQSNSAQVVIAIGPGGPIAPDAAQIEASDVRAQLQALGMSQTRIALAAAIDEHNVMNCLKQPDIDGVLLLNSGFGTVVKMLQRIALHCA